MLKEVIQYSLFSTFYNLEKENLHVIYSISEVYFTAKQFSDKINQN